jgi:hypothetical protein
MCMVGIVQDKTIFLLTPLIQDIHIGCMPHRLVYWSEVANQHPLLFFSKIEKNVNKQ